MQRAILILSMFLLPFTGLAQETETPAPTVEAAKPVLKVVEAEGSATTEDPIPEDPEEVILLVKEIIEAAKSGHWSVLVGLVLTLLVWILRKFNVISFVPKKAIPWITAALGIVGYIGVSLSTGMAVEDAIMHGFLTGVSAVGLWELIGKHLLKKPKKAEA